MRENTSTEWVNKEVDSEGNFNRQKNQFETPFGEGEGKLPVEPGRYRLLWAPVCPWAHRSVIVRKLLGLEDVISLGTADPKRPDVPRSDWAFTLDEGDVDALAFSTGMAAITALMEIFKPGDHIIIDEDLYGGSIRLFHSINVKNGLTFTSVDLSSVDVEDYIQDNTKAIYAETPTNPMMRVSDLKELSKKAKKHELLLIVDNTFLSPYFQNPLKLGADIVVHSGTKYLGGHNDTLAGFLITNREDIQEQLRFIIKTTGATLAPMDSWLILRGIKTLGVRMDRAQENALKIAHFLEKQEYVTRVLYPGLESHPGYELMKKQARGFGSILTFEVDSKERAYHILENVKLIQFAESLGGTETLITYPITQTHADLSREELDRNGITDRILRLSVGIEGAEDLIADLEAVLK